MLKMLKFKIEMLYRKASLCICCSDFGIEASAVRWELFPTMQWLMRIIVIGHTLCKPVREQPATNFLKIKNKQTQKTLKV